MSPESASCSTRSGSGVCGGGSRSAGRGLLDHRRGPVRLRGLGVVRALAAAAPALAVLQHRAVVGRVAHQRVDLAGDIEVGTPAAARRPLRRGLVRRLVAVAAQRPVAGRGQPRGHLVERGGGDDQHAEEARAAPAAAPRRTACAAGRGGARRRRSRSRRRPRAAVRRRRGPAAGCPWRCGRCRAPRRPSAAQPTTWRPAGPLCSGSRRLRQPTTTQRSAAPASRPCRREPVTTTRTAPISGPPSCHQTAAAETTARPNMSSPTPSRRCSGSRSRAPWPMPRATAPSRGRRPARPRRPL